MIILSESFKKCTAHKLFSILFGVKEAIRNLLVNKKTTVYCTFMRNHYRKKIVGI